MTTMPEEPREFTDEQLLAALKRMGEEVRREAFAAGQPIVILRGSNLGWIYPDGHEASVPLTPEELGEKE